MKDIRLIIRIKNNLILEAAEGLWGKDISQIAIAEKLDVSSVTIGDYLNFKRCPISKCRPRRSGLRKHKLKLATAEVGACGLYWTLDAMVIAKGLGHLPEEIFPEQLREIKKNLYVDTFESAGLLKYLEERENPEEEVMKIEFRERVRELLSNSLTLREQKVLKMRFGIDEEDAYTLKEVGDNFGVTQERVRQIETKALMKLRHPSKEKTLLEALPSSWESEIRQKRRD